MALDPLQADIARIALAAAGPRFALAGGNALIAHDAVARPTEDVDLFSPAAGDPARVLDAVTTALGSAGYQVRLTRPVGAGGDYVQLAVRDAHDREVLLDLARDWRAHPPAVLDIGPVLDLRDAIAAKVVAMVSRGLPRDFIDVAAVLRHRSRPNLIELATSYDPGLPASDFPLAMRRLDALPDDVFSDYALTPAQIAELRAHFSDWPRQETEPPDPSS